MATGIVAALGVSTSATYTALSDAQLQLACTGTGSNITVNSASVYTGGANLSSANVKIFVAAGASVTIATGSAATCVVSALES